MLVCSTNARVYQMWLRDYNLPYKWNYKQTKVVFTKMKKYFHSIRLVADNKGFLSILLNHTKTSFFSLKFPSSD